MNSTTNFPEHEPELLRTVLLIFKKLLKMVTEEMFIPEALLDRADVMRRLHVCRTTLYKWKKTGVLVPCRIGNRDYYREADLQKFF